MVCLLKVERVLEIRENQPALKKKAWKWSAAKNRTSFHRDKTMLFLRGREAGEGTDGERGEGGMEKRAV